MCVSVFLCVWEPLPADTFPQAHEVFGSQPFNISYNQTAPLDNDIIVDVPGAGLEVSASPFTLPSTHTRPYVLPFPLPLSSCGLSPSPNACS